LADEESSADQMYIKLRSFSPITSEKYPYSLNKMSNIKIWIMYYKILKKRERIGMVWD
jgi:hypothetical protein